VDRLNKIWEIQERFTRNFIDPDKATVEEKIAYTKEILLHLVAEIDELLAATGKWKKHRLTNAVPTMSGILEEGVDMLKFLINIFITFGIKPAEVYEEFKRKSLVVEERFKWEQVLYNLTPKDKVAAVDLDGVLAKERFKWEQVLYNLTPKDKVAAVDLDGVLAKYPENWIAYLNKHLGTSYKLEDMKFTNVPFPEIPRSKYFELKHKFRDEGYESLYVVPFEDAAEFTNALKDMGYKIIILSARPYYKYKRMQADTIMWMKKHGIRYDAFIWDEKKHLRIMKEFPFIQFIVEDNPSVALEVAACGYTCFLRDRPYNRDIPYSPNIIRVRTLSDIIKKLEGGE